MLSIVILSGFVLLSNSSANEMNDVVNENVAEKLGVAVSDVEFSNISEQTIDRLFLNIRPNRLETPIGIASESIEEETFTWGELLALYNIQVNMYKFHIKERSQSSAEFLISAAITNAPAYAINKIIKLYGFNIPYLGVSGSVAGFLVFLGKFINNESYNVMTRWLNDGEMLLKKALETNRKEVTLKYVKLTWKTSGHSIISGGMVLK